MSTLAEKPRTFNSPVVPQTTTTLVAVSKLGFRSIEHLLILRPGTTRIVVGFEGALDGDEPVQRINPQQLVMERNRREIEEPWTMGREGWDR